MTRPEPVTMAQPRSRYDGMIIDLDGVIWLGASALPGSAEAVAGLRARGIRLVFLTNDPVGRRADHAERLRAHGIEADEGAIVTAAEALARLVVEREGAGATTFAVGSAGLKAELMDTGLQLVAESAADTARAVAVGAHDGFSYDELRAATRALRCGARLYAAGRDATFPTPDGPWPATGAVVAAIEVAAGATATIAGKPEPHIFAIARAALGGCTDVAVVGDNLDSDIAGGHAAGLTTILVLTGTHRPADIAASLTPPHIVAADLAAVVPLIEASDAERRA